MKTTLPAPRLAEAYEVIEVVRQGGLSTTLRARHRGSGELRCIDVLRPAPGAVDALERRLDAEARPLMELRHPHVARLVDAAVGTSGEACLVREDQDGVTLRRLTGERRPSVALATEILRQTAEALAYLHSRGRRVAGLAPEGILLGADASGRPRVLLADLGLAKDWQEEAALTAAGLFVGRLRYTAPEQFESGGRQQAPADVYAFGLVAYELLTGRHPVSGDSASSLIAGHLFRPPLDFAESDPAGEVPEPLRRLVLSALAKAPGARPEAAQLASDLEQIQADLPAVALSPDGDELGRWIDLRPPMAEPASGGSTEEASDEEDALQAWLDEARALAREEKFVESRDVVRKVLKTRPDHSDGLMLLASVEACLKIQSEESKPHQTAAYRTSEDEAVAAASNPPPQTPAREPSAAATSRFGTLDMAAAADMQTMRIDPSGIAPPAVSGLATTVNMDAHPEGGREESSTPAATPSSDEMQTLRLDPSAIAPAEPASTGAGSETPPGSQLPGAPGSTERLDLPEGGPDEGRTKTLAAEVMERVSADRAESRESDGDEAMESGKTLPLDSSSDAASSRTGATPPPLPGTVTLPMEQIREAEQQSDMPAVPTAAPEPVRDETVRDETVRDEPGLDHPASFADTPVPNRQPSPPSTPPPKPESTLQPASPQRPPQSPASAGELGFGGAPPAAFAERRGRRGRNAGRGRSRGGWRGDPAARKKGSGLGILVGAAVAAVLVFVIGYAVAAGVDLRALVGLEGGSEVVVPPSETPPVAADPGWLVLDAAPWAEIVQIVDSVGENVQLRIRHTPARYELPPGTYTVVMSAEGGESQTFEPEVRSGETTEVRADLRALDSDDYFRLMGWR